jgi:hypothetical protein
MVPLKDMESLLERLIAFDRTAKGTSEPSSAGRGGA